MMILMHLCGESCQILYFSDMLYEEKFVLTEFTIYFNRSIGWGTFGEVKIQYVEGTVMLSFQVHCELPEIVTYHFI